MSEFFIHFIRLFLLFTYQSVSRRLCNIIKIPEVWRLEWFFSRRQFFPIFLNTSLIDWHIDSAIAPTWGQGIIRISQCIINLWKSINFYENMTSVRKRRLTPTCLFHVKWNHFFLTLSFATYFETTEKPLNYSFYSYSVLIQ